jgi:transcriptional regulator with XRE-family HTH domain
LKKEELARKIGKRIVELREKKGLSQSDLARACLKDRQSIDRIEKGKTNPTLFTLHLIADALEISLAEVVKESR